MGSVRKTSAQIQVADSFRPMPEYYVDPLELTAIGLKLGEIEFGKARLRAQERGLREMAIIGNASIRVALRPPADMRPPEGWLHEFVKPKYLARAKEYVKDA